MINMNYQYLVINMYRFKFVILTVLLGRRWGRSGGRGGKEKTGAESGGGGGGGAVDL